ncbi:MULTISPECIES: MFS transporter [unclassified Bacillus (in: firmicutes)]|uniref:MFS transporter n=1 Tax=unclassified Bacillus (in: firmicutes) TaxID=185979 RepID=UPI002034FEED
MGLGSALVGVILKMGGYIPNAKQTATALNYIEISFIWIPLVICILIGITLIPYKLDDKRAEMDLELERRRSGATPIQNVG